MADAPNWPLETNVCRTCDLAIQLMSGIGWLHVPVPTGRPEWADTQQAVGGCEAPDPKLRRCGICTASAGTRPDGTLVIHVDPRTLGRSGLPAPCGGTGLPGLPPRDESEAFER